MAEIPKKVEQVTEKFLDLLESKIDECKKNSATNEDMYVIYDGLRVINHITQIEQRIRTSNTAAQDIK